MKTPNLLYRALCCIFVAQMALPASLLAQLTISVPTFPTTNTVHFNLAGAQSTNSHIIFFTPNLTAGSIASWTRMTTGTVGQTSFDLTKPSSTNAFFTAGIAPVSTPTVSMPVFSPGTGSYGSPTNVTVTCATPGAAIYYTTNGNTPTTTDAYIYNGSSIYVSGVTTLKARAFASGYNDSAVTTATYTINAAPFVYAGGQQIISSSPTTLQGVVRDDGLTGGGIKFTNWTKVSGPGIVTFGNANVTNTTASFSANGIYVLKLSGSDGQYTNTSQVTIAYNTTLSVALITPADGSSYTVPTNIILEATASISGSSIASVGFYANGSLIGTVTNSPYSLNWKSVPAGNLVLTAVANTSDSANTGLASTPVNITVNWPTNVGQVTLATTDLQIPVSGLPITVNRQYNTQYGTSGSFGYNGRLDYEAIRISKTSTLSDGYTGLISGGQDYIIPNNNTLVTVTLDTGEQFGFVPHIVFQSGGQDHIGHSSVTYLATIRFVFDAAGSTATLDPINAPSDVGMVGDTYYNTGVWQGAIYSGYPDVDGQPLGVYEPDFSQFAFTAPDGTKYTFNSDGSVATKTDRNGNTLTYSSSGITWSNPNTGVSKQVNFTRDGNNRITEIYDAIAIANSGSPTVTYAYDDIGNLTNVARLIQRSPAVYENTGYTYTNANFPNNLTTITDPRGTVSTSYEYDSSGRLTRQYDALARYTSYIYDTANHRQIVTDRLNNSTVQNFTAAGQLASVQDANGAVTSYSYDAQGRKITETNPLGATSSFAYDQNNDLVGATNEIGNVSSATYNQFGQVLVSINANCGCSERVNGYDANGNLIATTNAVGVVSLYAYDSNGNRIAETNTFGLPEQTVTKYQYDAYGDLTNAVNAIGSTTSYAYDENGNRLTQIRTRSLPSGGTETLTNSWVFDADNRVIATITPQNLTNRIYLNGIGKQSAVVDALGRTNLFFYNVVELLTNTTYADGISETFSYDAEGRKISGTDRGGRTTTYAYDAVGRLTQTTFPNGSYNGSIFDAAGHLIRTSIGSPPDAMSFPGPSITTAKYSYDAAGRQVAVTNALNQGVRYAYDANGNKTSAVDALGRATKYVYDSLNRQVQIIYPDSTSDNFGFDGLDRKISATNQAGIVTRYGFDGLGRLTAATNAFGTSQPMVTCYVYDEVGNLLQQIDVLARTNKFEYDSLGRRLKQILPASQVATFGYDVAGNLIRQTNFNGVIVTNQYDALNRLTNKSSINSYKITFAYSPTSQRTNMTDASGTTSYTYDTLDRLLTKATPEGTLTYAYDGFGNLITAQSSTANGVSITNSYDALNRLANVVDRFNNSTIYGFDAVGNLQTAQLPNNVTNTYTYDSLNRLTNLVAKSTNSTVASFAYKLAPAGNRTNLVETVSGTSRTNVWIYDPLYRLTNETITAIIDGTISYKYDGVGNRTNRTSSVAGITNQTFVFNSNDQPTNELFDANGNTRTNNGNTFGYDVENHLTNATVNGINIVIVYDGDGNRVKKIVGTTTNLYLVDDHNLTGSAQVVEEKIISGGATNLVRQYTYGLDLISQRDTATAFYGYDGNGNTRYLTATNAAITDTYVYDAFGVGITNVGATTNFYRYSGEQFDPNLGFVYLRARYLNPNSGRFVSRDSFEGKIFDPASLHKYNYCVNDPVNRIDPSGLQSGGAAEIGLTGIIITRLAAQAALATVKALVVACSVQLVATTVANAGFNVDTTSVPGPCAWRGKSRERILFHYSIYPTLSGNTIWSGTWLTDRPDLSSNDAKYGLGLGGRLPTTVFAIRVKNEEISGGGPVQYSSQAPLAGIVAAREWITTVALPLSRIVSTTPILQ